MEQYENLGCLQDIFKRQAEETPNKVAVVGDDGTSLTFGELDHQTDLLSRVLVNCGVGPDLPVGIYMERCVEYVVSYIAILKAGGAYIPLDVTYPTSLLQEILSDAKPRCILSNESWAGNFKDESPRVISLSQGWETRLEKEASETKSRNHPTLDNLAYIVYSSGTTGKPKGIMCPHRGAVYSYTWRHLEYPFEENDRVASNVFFVWEMLRPLLKGIPLFVIPDTVIYDPPLLSKFIKNHKITRILFTPSLLETVIDSPDLTIEDFKSLRVVWFCGEVVTTTLLARCIEALPHVRFVNLYSISECHDVAVSDLSRYWKDLKAEGCNDKVLQKRKFAPVGKVLPDVQVYILDDDLQEQPAGVPGEIYVGGPTLARGYLNRPEMNAKRFINRPENLLTKGTSKLYRTGDWGLMLANRILEICGRCDSMVKIRGYSIETQAVESALLEIPQVNTCYVMTEGEEGTDKQLVAYIVPQDGATKKEIRTALKHKLPFYMIPAYFIFLTKMPVLPASGKVDKKSLPPVTKKPSGALSAEVANLDNDQETTKTERTMIEIWSDILQFPVTDVEESFFDLGGHSLLAARLLGKIREVYAMEMNVQTLFANPTISELASAIDNHMDSDFKRQVAKVDLVKEVKLNKTNAANFDIQLRAFWRSATYSYRLNTGRVFLTGATGFLGAYLLRDLLAKTQTQIYCLVRKSPNVDNKERLRKTLAFYELLDSGKDSLDMQKEFDNRVHAINGDVALVELGMDVEDYTYLSYEIDIVIHAAAYVNLLYPYDALKGTNVYGTRNVLLFSTLGKIKPLHYISTNSVFPNGMKNCKEQSSLDYVNDVEGGYSQSKWVAEQLVMEAIDSGLPATIYRIGNISGDRINAGWNPADFILLVVRASLNAGVWPDVEWEIEMTPVDFVSDSVIRLSQNVTSSVHKIFHLINPRPITSDKLYEHLKAFGHQIEMVPFNDWCEKVQSIPATRSQPIGHPSPRSMLDTVLTAKDSSLFSYNTTFDQTVFETVMASHLEVKYPTLTTHLIGTYLQELTRRKVIPNPERRKGTELRGKVALVTGASSGIGEAVSIHLATAGATVCVAARRQDRLLKIKEKIQKRGGTVKELELDVTNRDQFINVVNCIEEEYGSLDILVNNAGVMYYTHMHNVMMDDWDRMIDVNCRGVSNGIGAVLTGMIKRGRGHIVNTSSDAGRRGFPGLGVYSGTKFFVEGLSQALRHEVKGKGIRVTCIQPGDVKTELILHNKDADAKEQYDGSNSCKILDPDDIGRAVLYAVTQPDHVGVNEILIEPKENPI